MVEAADIWDDSEHPDTSKVRELRAEIERLQVHSSVLMREIERLRWFEQLYAATIQRIISHAEAYKC
jgi:hypothetical protein